MKPVIIAYLIRSSRADFSYEPKETEMDDTMKAVWAGLFRHVLTIAAGAFGLDAFLTDDIKTWLVAGGLALVGMVWSYVNKKKAV